MRPATAAINAAIRAEWTKLWSVRSTWYSLCAAAALTVAQVASAATSFAKGEAGELASAAGRLSAGTAASIGVQVGQVALIALAMLVITAEYATGSIRSSLLWVPVRRRLVVAKVAVVAVVTAAVGLLLGVIGMVTASLIGGDLVTVVASEIGSDLAVIALYVSLISLLTLGVGLVVRSAAGTLTVVFLLLLVLPNVLAGSSLPVVVATAEHLPGTAATVLLTSATQPYGSATAFVVLALWALAMLVLGSWLLRTRDA